MLLYLQENMIKNQAPKYCICCQEIPSGNTISKLLFCVTCWNCLVYSGWRSRFLAIAYASMPTSPRCVETICYETILMLKEVLQHVIILHNSCFIMFSLNATLSSCSSSCSDLEWKVFGNCQNCGIKYIKTWSGVSRQCVS